MPRILLLGGNGKLGRQLTRQLLARGSSYQVTSVVARDQQKGRVMAAAADLPGRCDVTVVDLEGGVAHEKQAESMIGEAGAEWVVWSVDSGGKDGRKRTYAIEQDACRHFIRAATALPQVNTFLMTSLIGARRDRAPWWTDAEWERLRATRYVSGVRRYYGAANLAADECLTAAARKRGSGFRALVLRLGSLTDEKKEEKVALGKTRAIGTVGRTAVTRVAVELLERAKTSAWLDLLEGDETVEDAVKRVVDEGVDCIEGEDVEALMEREAKIDAEKSRTKSVTANGENLRLNFGHDHVFS